MTVDEAREQLNSAINKFIEASDGIHDGEMVGDWVLIAHLPSVITVERARYYTIASTPSLPTHTRIGLHNVAIDIQANNQWDMEEGDEP